ncbi:lysylphosphatidylglycerol synthase domain-containing protein [Thermobifida cellulosilytica]|uniref:lysylphosphatidylglycerol synthase domain-containing protein n=1 Tax=Thermobifida cellulosilytica TaxID=144786 RepID=UPI000AEBAF10|nr:lysylphosphatidylglycerol synthase domain-containing protein [Thermobifida cellulosilytica]
MVNRPSLRRWGRAAVGVLVLGCAALALRARWHEAGAALAALSPWTVAGALAAAMAGLGAQMLAWRALLADLGSPLPLPVAARVMFVGQLGKYLPGSVWAFVAQVELARDRAVPRRRGAAATVLAIAVTLTVNLLVAAVLLPLSAPEAARRWWWVWAAVPLLAAVLHPRVVTWLLHRAGRLVGRLRAGSGPELDRLDGRGMAAAVAWTLASWVPLGVHVWLLTAGVGGGWGSWAPAVGGYALAWTLGVAAVFAPAGLGVREAVLVAALAPVLDPGSALVVAALSRLVTTVADLLWALLCLVAVGSPPRTRAER